LGLVTEFPRKRIFYQAIDANQEGRQSFPRTRRRGNQHGSSRQDVRPALLLRLSRLAKPAEEPLANDGVCPIESGGRS